MYRGHWSRALLDLQQRLDAELLQITEDEYPVNFRNNQRVDEQQLFLDASK